MNGDNQQLPPDQNQAGGQWQFRPDDKTPPQAVQQHAAPAPATSPQSAPASAPAPTGASVFSPATAPSNPVEPTIPEPMAIPAEISWTASEYVAHTKGVGWYLVSSIALVGITIAAFLVTRDIITTTIIVVIALLVGVSSAQKPRVLPYHLSPQGLTISNKFYPYSQFKSFSIMDEGVFSSIMFLPMQRFMPSLSIYYDPEDEERIVAALSVYLPMEMRKHDLMDNLARRLRF